MSWGYRCWLAAAVAWVGAVGMSPAARAVGFNWVDVSIPPNPEMFFSGSWSDGLHWDGAVGFPDDPSDTANISQFGVGPFTVTLDLDAHIGGFSYDSPDATFEANGQVFRVDGDNNMLDGQINWTNSQVLDSGAGTFNQNTTMDVFGTSLIDVDTFNQNGTLTVQADGIFNTTLTVFDGLPNIGLVDVDTSAGTTARLIMQGGTFVNDTASAVLQFSGVGAGVRSFQGDLINHGIVDVQADARFDQANNTFTNNSQFFISAGATLQMQAGGQTFNQNGGTLGGQGTFNPQSATFNFNGGEVTGNAVTLTSSTLNIAPTAGRGAFIMRATGTFSGDLDMDQTLTLRADASVNTTVTSPTGFTNSGDLTIETIAGTTSALIVNSSPLVNHVFGLINFNGASGTRRLQSDLVNNGVVNVNGFTQFNRFGDTFTNEGMFTVAPGETLEMQAGGQTFNQDGGTLDVQGTFNPQSATFNFNGGNVTGNAVTLTSSTLNIAPTAGDGSFVMRANGAFSGDLAAGQFLTARADISANTIVTSNTGITNGSTLTVESTAATTSTLIVNNSPLVNSAAGTIDFNTAAGTLRLQADVVNAGTFNVNGFTQFSRAGDSFTNEGMFTVAPGETLEMQAGGQTFNQDGGTLDVQGTFNPQSATFNFNGGNVTGNAVTLTSSTLNIAPTAGDGAFIMRSSGSFSGNLAAGQFLTVLSDAAVNTTVTSNTGLNNASTLTVESTAATASTLIVNGDLLFNGASGMINFNTASGTLRLQADLVNAGAFNINGFTQFNRAGDSFTNEGVFTIASGITLQMQSGGQVFNQNAGTLDVQGVFDPQSAAFNFNGGNVTGNPLTMTNSTLNIGPDAGGGSFILRANGTFTGDLNAGQSLTVLGDATANTAVTSSGFTNAGTLAINTSAATVSRLLLAGGVLTNDPTGVLEFADVGGGLRELRGGLENLGTVNVDQNATIGDTGQNHLNSGQFNVNATATIVGDSFTNQAGGVIAGTGTLNVSALAFTNAGAIAPGNSAGALAITGDVAFAASGSLVIELGGLDPGSEHDQLTVTGNATLAGALNVSLISPFTLSPGLSFEILNVGAGLTGQFSGLQEGGLVGNFGGTNLLITYAGGDGNDVALLSARPGDFDIDGDVDGIDFLKWQRGESPRPLTAADLADWEANYGADPGALADSAAVPEPATWIALMLGLLALLFDRADRAAVVPTGLRKSPVG